MSNLSLSDDLHIRFQNGYIPRIIAGCDLSSLESRRWEDWRNQLGKNAMRRRSSNILRKNLLAEKQKLDGIYTDLTDPVDKKFDFKASLWYVNKYVFPQKRNFRFVGEESRYLNIPKKGYKKYQVGRGGIISNSQIPDSDSFKERLSKFIEGVVLLLSEDIKILEEKIAKHDADALAFESAASAAILAADAEVVRRHYGW